MNIDLIQRRLTNMENKEIYIDDVDVSECEHYEDLNCFAYRDSCGYPLDCKDNPNCYYKQLKRKEQECEELKRELQAQRAFTAHEQKLIYCVAYDETCKTGNDCKQEKCIFKDNIKLKQALAEIKEIAENSCCLQPTSTCEEYENCKECSRTNDDETVKQILQKISECEVRDDKSNR